MMLLAIAIITSASSYIGFLQTQHDFQAFTLAQTSLLDCFPGARSNKSHRPFSPSVPL